MPTSPLRGAARLALLLALGACQTYDFEPVKPLSIGQTQTSVDVQAVANKPNFMLLVDKSGSMDQPVDGTIPACHVGGINGPLCGDPQKANPCDTTQCPTRWSELSKALDGYITQYPLIGRYGLTLFPAPEEKGICAVRPSTSGARCPPAAPTTIRCFRPRRTRPGPSWTRSAAVAHRGRSAPVAAPPPR